MITAPVNTPPVDRAKAARVRNWSILMLAGMVTQLDKLRTWSFGPEDDRLAVACEILRDFLADTRDPERVAMRVRVNAILRAYRDDNRHRSVASYPKCTFRVEEPAGALFEMCAFASQDGVTFELHELAPGRLVTPRGGIGLLMHYAVEAYDTAKAAAKVTKALKLEKAGLA